MTARTQTVEEYLRDLGRIEMVSPDEECDLDYVPNTAAELPEAKVAISNSLGFGGHNATILIKKYEG